MMREGSEGPGLDAAIHRLDRALGQLELRVNALAGQVEAANGELFELDRAHLAAELDAAKSRERELEAAGAEASAVLGQAIAELRAALSEGDPVETPAGQDGDYSAQDA